MNQKGPEQLEYVRHSLAHLLAAAVLELYPDALRTIGPATENGFYYDFDLVEPISDKDLAAIEAKMREILPTWNTFEREEVTADAARMLFADNPYKLELIEDIAAKGERITLYHSRTAPETEPDGRTHAHFVDLCRGGHVENPRSIPSDSFALSHVAGAYWRGNEKNKMLTRIYGLAFASKDELDAYRTLQEELKKRDHKKLGRELDLFTFSELVGPGLPLWTPKGALMRTILDDFVWQLRKNYGYERVEIPHITKQDLYEKSGHWAKYADELFKITTREEHVFAMKPMNCPHHAQIFARKQWSYREMPQRYANTTMVYRDEQSGELSGLSRVRAITQDDAHVFCRLTQVKTEMGNIWEIISEFYKAGGFTLTPRLSLHDPHAFEKYLGTKEMWATAEDALRELVKEKGQTAEEAPGEAAFYGPKIDFMAHDSIGRTWQLATIQLDMNQPERFDLFCINEEGVREPVVMLHAAIMGSIERYLSILIEHYAGAFPLWLSPVQIAILPIGESHRDYARKAFEAATTMGLRPALYDANDTLGKRIREVKLQKIPYYAVVGDEEVKTQTIMLESGSMGRLGALSISAMTARLADEVQKKAGNAPL